jgi:hypothetical protein
MSGYIGDGIPDSGRFELASDGSVRTGPGDASMLCIFYKRAVHNAIKSAGAGRPIYEDEDYVRIQQPGDTTQVVDRPAQDSDKRRWPAQWQAYAAGKDQVAEGTPLGLLFPRHPSAVAMLQAIGIMTVEHLANANATAISAIGMHGQDYVSYAQKYIHGATSGAKFHQMQLELEHMTRDKNRLEKTVEDLQRQIQQINSALLAQAGVGVPLPGLQRQQGPAPATPMPGGSMPRAPSFGGSAVFDPQTAQIDANHSLGPNSEPAGETAEKKKGGWPKGKPRKAAAA